VSHPREDEGYYLVGRASVLERVSVDAFDLRARDIVVEGRDYRVLWGSRDDVASAADRVRTRLGRRVQRVLDRVLLVWEDDGVWAVASAFFESEAVAYGAMISEARNTRCATCLLEIARVQNGAGAGGLVLDFGCGTGVSTRAIADAGYEVCGFDASPAMRGAARVSGVRVEDDLERLADESVTLVISCYVFHFGVREADLRALARIIRSGGVLAANFHKDAEVETAHLQFPKAGFELCQIDADGPDEFGTILAFRRGVR
jgi:SAM-dependent methyltransferase